MSFKIDKIIQNTLRILTNSREFLNIVSLTPYHRLLKNDIICTQFLETVKFSLEWNTFGYAHAYSSEPCYSTNFVTADCFYLQTTNQHTFTVIAADQCSGCTLKDRGVIQLCFLMCISVLDRDNLWRFLLYILIINIWLIDLPKVYRESAEGARDGHKVIESERRRPRTAELCESLMYNIR